MGPSSGVAGCGVGGWWGGCVNGRVWRSAESTSSARSLGGRALEALAGEGDVGRERVPVAPGSVVFGNRDNYGERARECPLVSARIVGTGLSVAHGDTVSHGERVRRSDFDSGCGLGSNDGERAHAQLDSAVRA